MALGEKLFEESGKVVGFKVTKVHPVEGMTMEVSSYFRNKGLWQVSKLQKHWIWHYYSLSSRS